MFVAVRGVVADVADSWVDSMTLAVPVVHIVFNRPRHAAESFERIRAQQPEDLFVIADGPRHGNAADVERCRQVREIYDHIDWDCRVRTDFAETNFGLKGRIVSGLDRVFDEVDQAIVIEDDCVAHDDFFSFCDAMLDRYRDDDRVLAITGSNFQHGRRRGDASYYFSKYNHCWGWASWSRAWAQNDPELAFWDDWRRSEGWVASCPDPIERKYWATTFRMVREGNIGSWAYPWMASVWRVGGLTATPNVNLVSNEGFGDDATHTSGPNVGPPRPVEPLGPIRHPSMVQQDVEADRYVFDTTYGGLALRERAQLRYWPRLAWRSLRHRLGGLLQKQG